MDFHKHSSQRAALILLFIVSILVTACGSSSPNQAQPSVVTIGIVKGTQSIAGLADNFKAKQVARLADHILKGIKPTSLPIESSEYHLSINLKTAQAIGIVVPDDVLRQTTTIVG